MSLFAVTADEDEWRVEGLVSGGMDASVVTNEHRRER